MWKLEGRYKSKETLHEGDSNGDNQYFRNSLYVIGGATDNLERTTIDATEKSCEPGRALK